MYYGYSLPSRRGPALCFTNEGNVPATLRNKTLVSLNQISQATQNSKRAILINPIASSPYVKGITTDNGQEIKITKEELHGFVGTIIGYADSDAKTRGGTTSTEPVPIFMGEILNPEDVPQGQKIVPIKINQPSLN